MDVMNMDGEMDGWEGGVGKRKGKGAESSGCPCFQSFPVCLSFPRPLWFSSRAALLLFHSNTR